MADTFNLRSFLIENKLTKNAQLLKEAEGFKTFKDSGIEGLYMDTVNGVKIYSATDSSVSDYCAYILEYPDGKIDIVDLDVSGQPISSEELQEYDVLSDKPEIADFISRDIANELGQEGGDDLNEVSDYGYQELMDAVDDYCDSDSPQFSKLQTAVDHAYEAGQIATSEFGHDPRAAYRAVGKIADESGLFDEPDRDMGWDERDDVEEAYTPKSKLELVIKQAWDEPDLEKAKQIIRDLIEPSRVKSKDTMLTTIEGLKNKKEFDYYLANSLLKFEKLGLNETNAEVSDDTIQKKYNEMFGRNPSTTFADVAKALGVPEDRVGTAVQSSGMKLNETTNKMTAKELKLVQMVKEAIGMEGYGNDNVNLKRDKEGLPPVQGPTYSEGEEIAEEEMVQKESLPKYESIEKLMQEIEEGTNKAMYEYKMNRMKELAEMIEAKVGSLEEGDHKDYINKKDVDQMRKDIKKLRDGEAKLRKEFDKKFNKKEKAVAPKEEKEPVTLAEGFDLRKFLVENKITANSRMLKEETNIGIGDIATKFRVAGISANIPVTYIVDYGNPAGTDPAKTTSVSTLVGQLAQEVEGSEDVDVMFNTDITQGQGELLGDNEPKTQGLTCKLEVYFEDSKMYEIWQ